MGEKSRNFRSTYYDKVGFRGAEEKKALQLLINEKPMSKEKLSKFCLRCSLPPVYREYVWKILLDVLPTYVECHESILKQRNLHYMDLQSALKIMRLTQEDTPIPIVHTLMYLMTFRTIDFNLDEQMASENVQNLISLATLFSELSSNEVISFWLFRNFLLHCKNLSSDFDILIETTEQILKKEDEHLFDYLKQVNAFECLPIRSWFDRCFVGILHQSSLERICDKIVGGSCKILSYVIVVILLIKKSIILCKEKLNNIEELLQKNSEEESDIIVNKAIDMYYS